MSNHVDSPQIYQRKRIPCGTATTKIFENGSQFAMANIFIRMLNQSSLLQTSRSGLSPFLATGTRFLSSVTNPPLERVGFIGLGNMGFHMANNLLKAGYNLVVHDRNYAVMQKFADRAVPTVHTPLEVAEASDAVITMLPSSPQVMDVYMGSEGLLGKGNIVRPWLLVDASTVDPQTSRRIAEKVSDCVLTANTYNWGTPVMLDAPVSGGVLGAEARTLTFMVGGPQNAFLAAQPLLSAMGKHSIYCGKSGNGAAAKICNNLAMAISMAGISEALALGQHLGISASTLSKIFNSSSARCWSSDTYNPVPGVMTGVPSSKNYEGGFSCKLMAKDLGLALVAAKEVGMDSHLATQVHEMYSILCNESKGNKDFSCLFLHKYSGLPEDSEHEKPSEKKEESIF